MNNKGKLTMPAFYVLLAIIAVITALTALVKNQSTLTVICLVLFALAAAMLVSLTGKLRTDADGYMSHLAGKIGRGGHETQNIVPIPTVTLNKEFETLWYNDAFLSQLLGGCEAHAVDITRLFKGIEHDALKNGAEIKLKHEKRFYNVSVFSERGGEGEYVLFFNDITEKVRLEAKYESTRPAVILVVFDNEDELLKMRESERMGVLAAVDSLIRDWVKSTAGICRCDANSTSLIVVDEQQLGVLMQEKFGILSDARKITVSGDQQVTLSIGVGHGGANLSECESWAKEALDMALGRGGDQAVVKCDADYSFFGGVSKSSEKQSKVKTRMLAKEIAGEIKASDRCIVMGHRFADLDAVGSAIGMMSIARALGVDSYVVSDRNTTLAGNLVDYYLEHSGNYDRVITPDQALDLMTENTMLVVVDTHAKNFVDCTPLYEKAERVIVIDHHRMLVNRIENALVFFHEPFASSASEMVAELAQYIDEKSILKPEAEALLAGIMLDTKSFVVKTGVRTFEAATFLRRRGADTVDVKMLFAGSIEDYAEKSSLVAAATVYNECAIACADNSSANIRIIASQAADEMLTLQGVTASFTLYESNDMINISARSLGKLNVQLIMERLGGGGHLTMAAAQLKGSSMEHALSALYEAIDAVSSERGDDDE